MARCACRVPGVGELRLHAGEKRAGQVLWAEVRRETERNGQTTVDDATLEKLRALGYVQ